MTQRIRIVALGDSTTAGTPNWRSPVEAPPHGEGDETSQYAYWLMKSHPDWDVLNRGVNGERTDQIAARFDRDVIQSKPRVVIIIAGVNDVYQGESVQAVTSQLRQLYDRALQSGISVIAGTIIPYNTAGSDHNARMRSINEWIRAQRDVEFVDTRGAVARTGNTDLLAESPDELHPSANGYRRMADAIRPVLERMLR
jgi:lysophospholipase L1-like esterase